VNAPPTVTLCHILVMENVNIEKCISEDEMRKKTRLSTTLVLKDIFSEDRLKEYLNDVEKK